MKTIRPYGLLAASLLACFAARGQAGSPLQVLGAAGQTFTANGLALDWTVGEVAVAAWQPANSTAQVLEGFHRGTWLPAEPGEEVAVYPNPFKGEVWVQAPATATSLQLEVYDLQGRQLRALTQTPEMGRVSLDLAELPVAGYVLRVLDPATGKRTTHLLFKKD